MFLTKWDPFETLTSLQGDLDNILNKNLISVPRQLRKAASDSSDWLPSVDIDEDKESYNFHVEIPGIDKEGIQVFVSDDRILNIKGERKRESEKKEKNYHRVEREYGSFARSFTLPDNADAEKIAAEYKNGVLSVRVAKKEAAKPKAIEVKVA